MSEQEFRPFTSHSFTFSISREMALDMGAVEATPEELERRNAEGAAFHQRQRERRVDALTAIADLRTKGRLTKTLLDLHAPDLDAEWSSECHGCEAGDWEPEWPCATALALAEHHGIDLPSTLPGTHYEGEFKPSDGKPFRFELPRWHFPAHADTPGL